MMISTYLSTNSVRTGVIAVEHKSLANHVNSLAKIAEIIKLPSQLKEMLYASRWHSNNSGYAFIVDGVTGEYIVYPPKPAKEGAKVSSISLTEGGGH
ncbi:MAG: hypothetical protein GY951_08800 [Psychromonas sp.]|nr:hypothetical protein [Psychromonas sp.]